MTMPAELSPLCRQFLAELDALCAHYGVRITPSGYDMLQIWKVGVTARERFDLEAIEDRTGEECGA
jgi:hypothetical protein